MVHKDGGPNATHIMPKRTFEQMSVVATGVQSFFDRFGKRRRYDEGTPPIAQWRCNLVRTTALPGFPHDSTLGCEARTPIR